MKRKTNVKIKLLKLLDQLETEVLLLVKDSSLLQDKTLNIFTTNESYNKYITTAKSMSNAHKFEPEKTLLGRALFRALNNDVEGISIHGIVESESLFDGLYISKEDLLPMRDIIDVVGYMMVSSKDETKLEKAINLLINRPVYIIGNMPELDSKGTLKKGTTFGVETIKRTKKDGSVHEAIKVFLTEESAMKCNSNGNTISKYVLSEIVNFWKGTFNIVIEPYKSYSIEFDPMNISVDKITWDKEKVNDRIKKYSELEDVYVLLSTGKSNYSNFMGGYPRCSQINKNIYIEIFENYMDAVSYVNQNQLMYPIIDGVYPIGVLKKNETLMSLKNMLLIAYNVGITNISMDFGTNKALTCNLGYFMDVAQYDKELSLIVSNTELENMKNDGAININFNPIKFANYTNEYLITDKRKEEIIHKLIDNYKRPNYGSTEFTLSEKIYAIDRLSLMNEKAIEKKDDFSIKLFEHIIRKVSYLLVYDLCERPMSYTLLDKSNELLIKNNKYAYLLVTERFDKNRNTEGKLVEINITNVNFLKDLKGKASFLIVTDGPNNLCFLNINQVIEDIMTYNTTKCMRDNVLFNLIEKYNMSYNRAMKNYWSLYDSPDILLEFYNFILTGKYPEVNGVQVEGYTAERLSKETYLSPIGCYNYLIYLRDNPKQALDDLNKGLPTK